MADTENKTKPKLTPEEKEKVAKEKNRQKILKMLFSNLTARRANFIYANIVSPDVLIMSNLAPEKAIKSCNSTFSIHMVTISDKECVEAVKWLFDILKIGTSTTSVIYVTKVISLLNKVKWVAEDLGLEVDRYGITTCGSDKEPVVWPMTVFQLALTVEELYASYCKIYQVDNTVTYDLHGRVSEDGITLNVETDLSKYSLDTTKYSKINIPLLEGFDTISTKELIGKHDSFKIGDYEYRLVTWVKKKYIDYATYFKNDLFEVISTRPSCRLYIKDFKLKGV